MADSISIPVSLSSDAKLITLRRAQVIQQHPGQPQRFAGSYHATLAWNVLTVDNCPIESACIASLVYSATTLLVAGDSLYEVVGPEHPLGPRVYGLVRR